MRLSLLLCLSVITLSSAFAQPTLDEMLWWFPEDTESLIVAQDALELGTLPPWRQESISQTFTMLGAGPLMSFRERAIAEAMSDVTVLRSALGGRHFIPPNGLGSSLFEGCSVIIVEPASAVSPEALSAMADETLEIGGHPTLLFREQFENDICEGLMCFPRPGVIVFAVDEEFLREVISRMETRAEARALPASLPEWEHLDTSAPHWGVRHYSFVNVEEDPSSPQNIFRKPDHGAVGVTFAYDPAQSPDGVLTYLTTNSAAEELLANTWSIVPNARLTTSGTDPIAIEIRANLNDRSMNFLALMLAMLGHVIHC